MSTDDPGGCSPPLAALPTSKKKQQYFWLWVMCILGLDYFSTLAYQPSITFEVAGLLGPFATAAVVVVTLLGVLPVYCYLAGKSPGGRGAIGLLEHFVRGWRGKTLLLVMLGFAATDFTMLKTISLADAAVHILQNDTGWQGAIHEAVHRLRDLGVRWLGEEFADSFNEQLVATLLLGFLSFVFWFVLRKGFNRNVVVLAVPLVALYLVLTGLILGGGIALLVKQPELVDHWFAMVERGDWLIRHPFWSSDGWGSVALVSILFLPNLALGLSGFEMSMILMPQVRGKQVRGKGEDDSPHSRVRNTRKILALAAVIMAAYLLGSSLVTTLLIPPAEMAPEGRAANRALAYLAHGGALTTADSAVLPWCGPWFGGLYDLATVLMLTLAAT